MSASFQDPDPQAHWDYFIGQTRGKRAVREHRSLTGDHFPPGLLDRRGEPIAAIAALAAKLVWEGVFSCGDCAAIAAIEGEDAGE